MKRFIYIVTAIAFLTLTTLVFAGQVEKDLKDKGLHVADLSETDEINLQINKLEQAIQQQQIQEIEKMLSSDYSEIQNSFRGELIKQQLETIFSNLSQTRQFTTQTNPNTGWKVTSTQDFYLRNPEIKVEQDKATVECDIGFFSATENYRNLKETLSFVQTNRRWFLSGSKNLFGFLEQSSKATNKELGTINSAGDIMLLTKDDFTSIHLLIPIILYNYGKTPIPRFNRTESLSRFEVDAMALPYGVVADVQVTPPNPEEFTHEFLFVTDVTSQKVLVSDKDEWVGEFGTEGSGQGQFWGPHGISALNCCHYFVADMFNNRIVTYYYDKGDEDPTWSFNLTAGLNWPIDVEVKEADRLASPPEPDYVAVVDHRNHRLALWEWAPGYYPGFDQYYGEYGSGEGQFIYPTSVCFGRDPETGWQTNDVFVTDYGNDRLVWLYIGPAIILWRGYYQFPTDAELTSVEIDNKGLVYVVDRHNAKIYKFATHPSFSFELLGIWGERGTADGQLYWPNMLQVAHGRYCPYPDPCEPFENPLGDVFVTESWGDSTGVRRFVIASEAVNLTAGYVPYNEDTGGGNFIWYTYNLTDFADVTEQVYRGAQVCTTYNRGALNYGSQSGNWNVNGHPHGETYTVKITANSIYGPTVEKSADVYVDTFTTHNPVITRGIRCNHDDPLFSWCDNCYQCIKEGQTYTIDVIAYDPDGDSLTYEWRCDRCSFHTEEGQWGQWVTTSVNRVCYHAPPPPGGGKPPVYEWLRVSVRNPYGGEASVWIVMDEYLYPSEASCLCGDVTGDGIINSADVVRLIDYLYSEVYIPDPIERADANNDCVVSSGDVVALLNYLYTPAHPVPRCCWIH